MNAVYGADCVEGAPSVRQRDYHRRGYFAQACFRYQVEASCRISPGSNRSRCGKARCG